MNFATMTRDFTSQLKLLPNMLARKDYSLGDKEEYKFSHQGGALEQKPQLVKWVTIYLGRSSKGALW